MAVKKPSPKIESFLPRHRDRLTLEPPVRVPLPSKVRVLGRDITIGYAGPAEGFTDAGEMHEEHLAIKVLEGQIEIEEADTVLHETIHGIDYLLALELTERQVRLLATALIGIFQDNPEYTTYLVRPLSRI